MNIEVEVTIDAPAETVWNVATDIERCVDVISGITAVEILDRPATGLVGLKWRETRTMFGKTATEDMWITESTEFSLYDVRAESHGMIYTTTISMAEADGKTTLKWDFGGEPQGTMAKVMAATMGRLFAGATRKMLRQDLLDIKAFVEKAEPASA